MQKTRENYLKAFKKLGEANNLGVRETTGKATGMDVEGLRQDVRGKDIE